jgi:hypothetical protein
VTKIFIIIIIVSYTAKKLNYIKITYNGESYSPIAYEMLESLQKGNNMNWTASYQQNFANNLQLTINYSGRKSDGAAIVHIGGAAVEIVFLGGEDI